MKATILTFSGALLVLSRRSSSPPRASSTSLGASLDEMRSAPRADSPA